MKFAVHGPRSDWSINGPTQPRVPGANTFPNLGLGDLRYYIDK